MPFLFQETYYATPGLQQVLDDRVRSLHQAQATQPSALASDWAKYRGDSMTYLALRLWTGRHYSVDAEHMRFMAEYNRTRATDAFMAPPDIEFFEPVSQWGTPGGAAFLVRTELEVSARYGSEWASWEQEVRADMAKSGGLREWRLYQFLGRESRSFRCEFWERPEAAEAFWRAPARRPQWAALPAAAWRRTPKPAEYDVLLQLGDPTLQ